jgi:hypothetical protein
MLSLIIQDHDTKCVSLVSFPSIVPRSHGLDPKRAPLVTRNRFTLKSDQCLARFFVLGAMAAARTLSIPPAAVLPNRAGASPRRDATDLTF